MTFLPVMQGFSPLVESPRLRMLTVFLFYMAQGIPLGFFYVAIPAYMAKSGASPAQIAAVVGMTSLPWSLKLVNGFIIDRYAYLPMRLMAREPVISSCSQPSPTALSTCDS